MLQEFRVDIDTGDGGFERRRANIGKRTGARADQDNAAGDLAIRDFSGEHPPRRNVSRRLRAGIMDAHRAVGFRSDLQRTDFNTDDAGSGSETAGVGGVRGLHDDRRGVLCYAKNFSIERGDEMRCCAVALRRDKRDFADDKIAVRLPVNAAKSSGCFGETGQRQNRTAEIEQKRPWIVAQSDEAGFHWHVGADAVGQNQRKHTWSTREHLFQALIFHHAVRRQCISERLAFRYVGQLRQQIARRRTILLGEENIEGNHRRALRKKMTGEIGKPVARPRPLAESRERSIVNINDSDRYVWRIGARLDLLIVIENKTAKPLDERWVCDGQSESQANRECPDQRAKIYAA